MKKVAVYLASSPGNDPIFASTAFELGRALCEKGFALVYGGANVGCMKAVADGALSVGGDVTGVFPEGFKGKKEYADKGIDVRRHDLTRMVFTKDFAERKKVMEELSDCCVVLPGAWGSLDELFTYMDNRVLNFHQKSVFVLNTGGYYDPIRQMMENMRRYAFIAADSDPDIHFCSNVGELMRELENID